MRFEIYKNDSDGSFYFQLLKAGTPDVVLMESDPYESLDDCLAGVKRFIAVGADAANYRDHAHTGDAAFSLHDPDDDEDDEIAYSVGGYGDHRAILAFLNETTDYEVNYISVRTDLSRGAVLAAPSTESYHFEQASHSNAAGFDAFDSVTDHKSYFHFNNAAGTPFLFSTGYATPASRDAGIRAVIAAAPKPERYQLTQTPDGHFFTIHAPSGLELARSKSYAVEADAKTDIAYLQSTAGAWATHFPRPEKRFIRSTEGQDQYRLAAASTSGKEGFETFRAEDNKLHYFHYNNPAGVPILFSQGYTAPSGRDNGVRSVIRNSGVEERWEMKEDAKGHYFTLRAANKQEIARSAYFPTAVAAAAALEYVKGGYTKYAEQYGVAITPAVTEKVEHFNIHVDHPDDSTALPLAGAALAGVGLAGAALVGGALAGGNAANKAAAPIAAIVPPPVETVTESATAKGAALAGAGVLAAAGTAAAMSAAPPAAASSGGRGGWLLPALLILAGLALLAWLLSYAGCFSGMNTPKVTATAPVVPPTDTAKAAPAAPKPEGLAAAFSDFKPVVLYFDNDQPDANSEGVTTKRSYEETYNSYLKKRAIFEREAEPKAIDAFFNGDVKKGLDDLNAFTAKLAERLKAGEKYTVLIRGFASPLANDEYNKALTERRIKSVENHIATYGKGELKQYVDNGSLVVTVEPKGKSEAKAGISDNHKDLKNAVYSIDASRERRVEIVNIKAK